MYQLRHNISSSCQAVVIMCHLPMSQVTYLLTEKRDYQTKTTHIHTERQTDTDRQTDRVNLLYDESVPALNESRQVALSTLIVRLSQYQTQCRCLGDRTERSQEIVCLPQANRQHSNTIHHHHHYHYHHHHYH